MFVFLERGATGLRRSYDWQAVQRFDDDGHTREACVRQFGFSFWAWTKAVERGAIAPRKRGSLARLGLPQKRYDWAEVQRYYDEGHTRAETMRRFGFWSASWMKAVERGQIRPRPGGKTVPEMLATVRNRWSIKQRLLRDGILQNRCDACGLTEWRGRPLAIQIDHRNGIHDDHRLENLRMLCPNCHSQTETFAAKNAVLKRRSRVV